MRWLLLKDLQILKRSPLLTALLVIYPIVLAVLIGFAVSRGPEKPKIAFLNEIQAEEGLELGEEGGFSQERGLRRALPPGRLRQRRPTARRRSTRSRRARCSPP